MTCAPTIAAPEGSRTMPPAVREPGDDSDNPDLPASATNTISKASPRGDGLVDVRLEGNVNPLDTWNFTCGSHFEWRQRLTQTGCIKPVVIFTRKPEVSLK